MLSAGGADGEDSTLELRAGTARLLKAIDLGAILTGHHHPLMAGISHRLGDRAIGIDERHVECQLISIGHRDGDASSGLGHADASWRARLHVHLRRLSDRSELLDRFPFPF